MKKKEDKAQCTYGKFLEFFPLCTKEKQEELLERLRKQPCPQSICGKHVQDSLNMLTYGQLDDMQTAASSQQPIEETCKVLLQVDSDLLLKEDVNDVFGFANFVTKEINRIMVAYLSMYEER